MATLGGFLEKKVLLVTVDSRIIVGTLLAADNTTNLVLKDAEERSIREPDDEEPSFSQPLGLYMIRGDNVCTVGLVDEELDSSIDWTKVKGHHEFLVMTMSDASLTTEAAVGPCVMPAKIRLHDVGDRWGSTLKYK